jgi:hypothetical protein
MMWGSQMTFAPLGLWLCGAIFGIIAVQLLLYPLRTHSGHGQLVFEAIVAGLLLICANSAIMELIGLFGGMLLVVIIMCVLNPIALLIGIVILLRNRRRAQSKSQLALADLLVIVLTAGGFPVVLTAIGLGPPSDTFFMGLAMLALFIRAFERLKYNKVPFGWPRTLFLLLYPYTVFGALYCSTFLFLSIQPARTLPAGSRYSQNAALILAIAALMGNWVAWQAKESALKQTVEV